MRVEVNGLMINYETSGKKGGPVVMMSHSLACSVSKGVAATGIGGENLPRPWP